MARNTPSVLGQVWQLQPYGSVQPPFKYVVVTPEPVEQLQVISAWAHALRHTAQGLDLPDHQAALEMLLERHPSWSVVEGQAHSIPVQLAHADKDEPEN